ncbi:hypothetical protein F0L17_08520 [Streptomyces sp. TRM43335]|uniref:Uncharacterized protein n=1 Tax=Streptomyces taklimakanensis TaxID=2569853 RepID=A0A6G2BA73_9ACTN|nr:hypothetical protein [Streptomyces taklimakanensis]MTE19171.1 hypothetical protein [Streptomyces taklimakanensis]
MDIAAQWRRPSGRRQPIADAAVAAVLAVGGLVLAGTVTSKPPPGADTVSSDALPPGPRRAAADGSGGYAARAVR